MSTSSQDQSVENKPKERFIAYVDGFNLYFGMREAKLDRFYWLDISALAGGIMRANQELVITKYFTSRVSFPPEKVKRQGEYLDALGSRPGIRAYFGQYEGEAEVCEACQAPRIKHSEKMTDVNIAIEIMKDAYADRFDTALLVTGDSDQTPTIRMVKELFPTKRVLCLFPPMRHSNRLKAAAHATLLIKNHMLSQNQLPDVVTMPNGYEIKRPEGWA